MENSVFELYMSDWWISLYVQNVVGFDVHVLAVTAVLLLIGLRKLIRKAKETAKLQPKPLLGVVQPPREDR